MRSMRTSMAAGPDPSMPGVRTGPGRGRPGSAAAGPDAAGANHEQHQQGEHRRGPCPGRGAPRARLAGCFVAASLFGGVPGRPDPAPRTTRRLGRRPFPGPGGAPVGRGVFVALPGRPGCRRGPAVRHRCLPPSHSTGLDHYSGRDGNLRAGRPGANSIRRGGVTRQPPLMRGVLGDPAHRQEARRTSAAGPASTCSSSAGRAARMPWGGHRACSGPRPARKDRATAASQAMPVARASSSRVMRDECSEGASCGARSGGHTPRKARAPGTARRT